MDFLVNWINHPIGSGRRLQLDVTDLIWENAYCKVISDPEEYSDEYVEPGTLLFRVHQKPVKEPLRDNHGTVAQYKNDLNYIRIRNQSIPVNVEFDDHWVSFTDNPNVITSGYFLQKGLTGDVIVLRAKKAVKIASIGGLPFESEVVAPLHKSDVVEILEYEKFKQRYLE
ncbi:hypothetical protein [Weissella confusa]|uniref:hypothetical protein n=1 Tax=Weissella confusa TaxID=1583 RepID=UPI0022FE1343|nr:hypothetical protein [Weissella confusa]